MVILLIKKKRDLGKLTRPRKKITYSYLMTFSVSPSNKYTPSYGI